MPHLAEMAKIKRLATPDIDKYESHLELSYIAGEGENQYTWKPDNICYCWSYVHHINQQLLS